MGAESSGRTQRLALWIITLVLGALLEAVLGPPIADFVRGPDLVYRRLPPYRLGQGRAVFGVEVQNIGRGPAMGLVFEIHTGGIPIESVVFDRRFLKDPEIIAGGKGQDFVILKPADPNRLKAKESRVIYLVTGGMIELGNVKVTIESDTREARDAEQVKRGSLAERAWRILYISALLYTTIDLFLRERLNAWLRKKIEP